MKKTIFLILAIIGIGVSIYFIHEKISPEEERTGVTSENLLKGIRIQQIGWNGEYWLIACENLSEGSFHLISFDGDTFKDTTPQKLKNMGICISSISTEDGIWIFKEKRVSEDHSAIVYRFDGKDVEIKKENVDPESYWKITSCNEEYCLIWDKKSKKLIKSYNGSTIDLTAKFEEATGMRSTFPGLFVDPIKWNGEYWLLRYGGKPPWMLVKYDGESFEFLLSGVREFKWNGEYWLITLMNVGEGSIVKYNGMSFEYISLPSSNGADALGWNGEYWLIATVNSPFGGSNALVRYDGYSITDLSKKFQECLSG